MILKLVSSGKNESYLCSQMGVLLEAPDKMPKKELNAKNIKINPVYAFAISLVLAKPTVTRCNDQNQTDWLDRSSVDAIVF